MKTIAIEVKHLKETDNLYQALSEKVELYRRKGYPYVHDSGAMYDALTEQDHEIIRICGRLDALEDLVVESGADHSVSAIAPRVRINLIICVRRLPNEE